MKINKTGFLVFLALIPIIFISQLIILKPHLEYGFGDVDWGFLSIYKTQNPYSLSQFIKNIEKGGTLGGVYTHQIYYIGIQHEFFGLNYKLFQFTTHIFKILATIAIYPLLLVISGSILSAFMGTLLFAFSYSSVGTMYTVVTSSDYSAIFSMGIFFCVYWFVVKRNIGNWIILFILFLLFALTLFLSTERMYQLPFFIGLVELFLIWQTRELEKNTIKRLLIIFLPLLLLFLVKPMIFLSYFLSHLTEIINGILVGNWNLLLTPFAALGSIILPHDLVKLLGVVKTDNFFSFLEYLINGPLPITIFISVVLGGLVFKKSYTIFQLLGLMVFSSILLYILSRHYVTHLISAATISQAFIGFYILSISIVSMAFWKRYKNRLLLGLFVGPIFAFLYIFLTWLGASASEVFAGIHRYLTIPALFISLFLATLFTAIFNNFYKTLDKLHFIRYLTVIVLLPLLFFISSNIKEVRTFFNYQLSSGFGAADKDLMRGQFNSYLDNLSSSEPSFFYFDFTLDNDNGYYYDNTLTAGFASWMLWHKNINFNTDLAPTLLLNDAELIRNSIYEEGNKKFIHFKGRNYAIENFYAFRLKDKKLTDIKKEILN